MILLLWIGLAIWFVVSFLGALKETYWDFTAPVLDAPFFWLFAFPLGPFLLFFGAEGSPILPPVIMRLFGKMRRQRQ